MHLTRDTAWQLLTEYTQSENLRKHALAVEAAVRGYARRFGEDEEVWSFVGLIHDFDYERYPDADTMDTFMCSSWYHLRYLSHAL